MPKAAPEMRVNDVTRCVTGEYASACRLSLTQETNNLCKQDIETLRKIYLTLVR